MKPKNIRIRVIVSVVIVLSFFTKINFADDEREPIYDTSGNAKELIASVLNQAKKENKRVLLQYGGNWCGWCYLMHDLFEENKEIKKILSYEYELVLVDTQSNPAIAEQYQSPVKTKGVPFFTVLDADGNVVTHQDTGSLEVEQKHDPAKVLAFLEQWKTEPQDASDVFDTAKALAAKENKKILLNFGAPWCSWCKRLDAFLHQNDIVSIVKKDFVLVKVDLDRMTGAKKLYERFVSQSGAELGGVPWFVIADEAGKPIMTSNEPTHGNVGFPVADHERDHFIKMLQSNAERISDNEIEKISTILEEVTKQYR